MNDLEFPRPPKSYKVVKKAKLQLARRDGEDTNTEVTVFMSNASGTPAFAVPLPVEYRTAWKNHERTSSSCNGVRVVDFCVQAVSYDQVLKDLQQISTCYGEYVKTTSMTKIIWVYTELLAPMSKTFHNKISFSHARTLVGMRCGIGYNINGKMYGDTRFGYRFNDSVLDDSEEAEPDTPPSIMDLSPLGEYGTVIPYTKEAWAALVNIEQVLDNAARALFNLTKAETAQILLAAGPAGLAITMTKEPTLCTCQYDSRGQIGPTCKACIAHSDRIRESAKPEKHPAK